MAYRHFNSSLPPYLSSAVSFTSPVAHWDLVMKSCSKFLRKTSNHLDITLSDIRPLPSGSHFHLQSISCLPLFSSVVWRIASIRSYLTESTTAQLVSSFITSRFDYCNSIFAGLLATEINHLHRIQNNAATLILRKLKRDKVSTLL